MAIDVARGHRQLVRFAVNGAWVSLIYIAIGHALLWAGVSHGATGAAALIAAATIGFVLHRTRTFCSGNNVAADGMRYAIMTAANSLLSAASMQLAIVAEVPDTVALVLVAAALPVTNFLAMRLWVFRRRAGTSTLS